MKIQYSLLWIASVLTISACQKDNNQADTYGRALFTLVPNDETGIHFINTVVDEKGSNFLLYEYFYNGAGVGVGDFNNDGLDDIYFAGNQMPDKLYLNKGNLKFKDITDKSGIRATNTWSTGVTLGDFNEDGYLDIYVCKSGNFQRYPDRARENKLYINNHDLTFTESAKDYGLNDSGYATHSSFIDFDNDGDQDFFVLNHGIIWRNQTGGTYEEKIKQFDHYTTNHLYENQNGKFVDVSEKAGILAGAFGLSVNVVDINKDGWLDLYVANDYWLPDFLYINNKNGTFRNASKESFRHLSLFAMGSDIQDFNNDGLVDIIVVDMMPESDFLRKTHEPPAEHDKLFRHAKFGYQYQYKRNTLQLNRGNGKFSEIGQLANIENTDWSWATLFSDFDNDGLKDLFVCNGYRMDNNDLDFIRYTLPEFINKKGGIGNFDNLEVLEITPVTEIQNYVFKNENGYQFSNVTNEWGLIEKGFSNGAACADLDNDGDLELIINNINSPASIYKNYSRENHQTNFVSLRFANKIWKHALNASIKLMVNGQEQFFDFRTQRGYMSTLPMTVHFGLPKAPVQDKKIEIYWRDGSVQTITDFEVNSEIFIEEKNASEPVAVQNLEASPVLFEPVETNIRHIENDFIDFNYEVLIPRMYSREGPGLAVFKNDGSTGFNIILGGSHGFPTKLYSLTGKTETTLPLDAARENISIVQFDLDNNGLQDYYFVNGSNEMPEGAMELGDEILINKNGKLVKVDIDLSLLHNKSFGARIDFNNDGWDDILLAGGVKPLAYPMSYATCLLENKNGSMVKVNQPALDSLSQWGIIKSLEAVDFNNDNWTDIIAAGHWSPIILLKNNKGVFEIEEVLDNYTGFWNTVKSMDFDNDGDIDFIAGNLGINSRFKSNEKIAAEIFAKDFSNDGRIDALINYYQDGKAHLVVYRDRFLTHLNFLKSKFTSHRSYAEKSVQDIFPANVLRDALHRQANYLQSAIFENDGKGHFTAHPLPLIAQIAPVQDIVIDDLNGDGYQDLILVGNDYASDALIGRYDASYGQLLMGKGSFEFEPIDNPLCNLYLNGDARNARVVESASEKYLIVAVNNKKVEILKIVATNSGWKPSS